MKFKIILIVLFTLSYSIGFGQVKNKKPIKMKYVPTDMVLCIPEPKDSLKPFYISNHLTTNKEYFTFLLWMYYVDRYSSKRNLILEYLPKDEVNFIRLFHPEYDNLPVLGLTNKQIIEYCTWKTSRLNEYILNKYVIKNKKQIKKQFIFTSNYSLFTLEAFTVDMAHIIDKNLFENWKIKDSINENNDYADFNHIKWNSNYLYPNFRIPTKEELFYANYTNQNFANSKGSSDKSIEYCYEQLKDYWNSDENEIKFERQIDYLIDLKIGTKYKNHKKRTYNYKYIDNKSLNDYKIEVVFDNEEIITKSHNMKNYALFSNLIIENFKKCREIDTLGKVNTKCNIIIIDEENAKPVFIKYDEYIKCYNSTKLTRDHEFFKHSDTSYSNYSGFRCVMFAPGY